MKAFAKQWESYRQLALAGAQTQDVFDLKLAFYGGALAFWNEVQRITRDGSEPMPGEVDALGELDRELEEFAAAVIRGIEAVQQARQGTRQ